MGVLHGCSPVNLLYIFRKPFPKNTHRGLIPHNKVNFQKQPPRGVLRKRCSENMQQIYRRTPMPKCDFNKVALQVALSGCF